MQNKIFETEYKKLNPAQKEAVDSIDGPVMVVAGPGTGKTQILSLRIGNILQKTDTKADGVLCLTFTNAAVEAMQARLVKYLGEAGNQVNIFTFHSFGMKIVEKYYQVLDRSAMPKLMDDADTALLFDDILQNNEWEYLRPRAEPSRYFTDLRSLISLLKRERISAEIFSNEVGKEIKAIEADPENISTRGESKGQLKKEVESKIEGLKRSREMAKFFELYEDIKKQKNVFDYDDVLENLVKITELSKDAVADIREQYLYVLVDEHQDSNAVQNDFLKRVWSKVERPNIFVVGDDRQLIYGFSGASIDHFAGFQKTFKGGKLITLTDNYRSTQMILDVSHALLPSVMTKDKLVSQSKENFPVELLEAESKESEIAACVLDIKEKVKDGLNPNDCAILVPKNSQVRTALEILHQHGLPVSSLEALDFFDQEEAQAFFRVLRIISNPDDRSALALSFFDKSSGVTALEAHTYIAVQNMREFSWDTVSQEMHQTLFDDKNSTEKWVGKLLKWKKETETNNVLDTIKLVGKELFLDTQNVGGIVSTEEIINTILALAQKEIEKNPGLTMSEFMTFLGRLESFGEKIPLTVTTKEGIQVLTLHSSKGLEFDYVWIAHMDERSLTGGRRSGFVLPEGIADKVAEHDVDRDKRKLYVAITRAQRFCTISFALYSASGGAQEAAKIIADLPAEIFKKKKAGSLKKKVHEEQNSNLGVLTKLVGKKYSSRYVSASLLNNFFECPWKWYFRNLLQLPAPEVEILEFGNTVHSCIDRLLKLRRQPSVQDLADLGVDKAVIRIITRWVQNRLSEIAPKYENEKSVSVKSEKFPHLSIYGKIDLVEYLDAEKLRVTDFKTGSVRKKSDIEKLDEEGRPSSYLRQLTMYAYLLEQSTRGSFSARETRLEFLEAKLPREAIYDRIITSEEIDSLIKDIADYDQVVKSGEWVDRPCNYNSYGKNTECEYCKRAEIYK